MVRVSAQKRGQASMMEPAQEQAVLEQGRARRRWAQALVLVRKFPPVAQWVDSRLQLLEVSTTPLDGVT